MGYIDFVGQLLFGGREPLFLFDVEPVYSRAQDELIAQKGGDRQLCIGVTRVAWSLEEKRMGDENKVVRS